MAEKPKGKLSKKTQYWLVGGGAIVLAVFFYFRRKSGGGGTVDTAGMAATMMQAQPGSISGMGQAADSTQVSDQLNALSQSESALAQYVQSMQDQINGLTQTTTTTEPGTGTSSPSNPSPSPVPPTKTTGAKPAPVPPTQTRAPLSNLLSFGSRGSSVAAVQRELGITSDGQFGPQTKNAVESFQKSHGLTVDGIVGPQTLAALNAAKHTKPATVHVLPKKPPIKHVGGKNLYSAK